MFYSLVIPQSLSDFSEVRILQWHFEVDSPFSAGELLLEIETQKAIIEIRALQSGILREIYCAEGQWVKLEKAITLAIFSDELKPMPKNFPDGLPPIAVDIAIL